MTAINLNEDKTNSLGVWLSIVTILEYSRIHPVHAIVLGNWELYIYLIGQSVKHKTGFGLIQ